MSTKTELPARSHLSRGLSRYDDTPMVPFSYRCICKNVSTRITATESLVDNAWFRAQAKKKNPAFLANMRCHAIVNKMHNEQGQMQ